MKLNQIKKACMALKQFIIFNDSDGWQWLSNGSGLWPVDGVTINEDSIPSIFDLTPEQKEKLNIRVATTGDSRISTMPQREIEESLKDMGSVWYLGNLYRALYGSSGMMFVDEINIKPAEHKDEYMEFRKRADEQSGVLIVVYTSLFVSAIVTPVPTGQANNIMEALAEITRIPVAQIGKMPNKDDSEESSLPDQMRMEEDT